MEFKKWAREWQSYVWTFMFPMLFIAIFSLAYGDIKDGGNVESWNVAVINLDEGVLVELLDEYGNNTLTDKEVDLLLSAGPFHQDNGTMNETHLYGNHGKSLEYLLNTVRWPNSTTSTFSLQESTDFEEAKRLLQNQEVFAVVVIPRTFSQNLSLLIEGESVRVLIDPSGGESVAAGSHLTTYVSEFQSASIQQHLQFEGVLGLDPIIEGPQVEMESMVDEDMNVFELVAPGLVTYGILLLAANVNMSLSKEAAEGTLDRLRTTGVSSFEFLLGNGFLFYLVGVIQFLVLIFGALAFGFDTGGNTWIAIARTMVVASVLILACVALGLFLSAFTRTEGLASAISSILTLVLAFLIGAFFPTDIAFTDMLPWKITLDAMKGTLLFERTIRSMASELIKASLGTLTLYILAAWLYNKRQLNPET